MNEQDIKKDIETIKSIKNKMISIDIRKNKFDIRDPSISMIFTWIPIIYYNIANFQEMEQNILFINSFFAFLSFYLFVSFFKEIFFLRKNIRTFSKNDNYLKTISELLIKYDYELKLKNKSNISSYDQNLKITKKLLQNLENADKIMMASKNHNEHLIENS